MKRYLLISGLALLIGMTSCKRLIMIVAGLRMPGAESKESVFEFLKKMNQDTNDVFVLDTNLLCKMKATPYKPGWPPGFRPIQIRCYDSSGRPVMQWSSCEGYLDDLKSFDSVPPKNFNGLDKSLSLDQDLAQYYQFDGSHVSVVPEEGIDYYFIVYFAKYFPRMSWESFRHIEDFKNQHPELHIRTYKVNVDVQQSWGSELGIQIDLK